MAREISTQAILDRGASIWTALMLTEQEAIALVDMRGAVSSAEWELSNSIVKIDGISAGTCRCYKTRSDHYNLELNCVTVRGSEQYSAVAIPVREPSNATPTLAIYDSGLARELYQQLEARLHGTETMGALSSALARLRARYMPNLSHAT
jgi:hypothetical protein